MTEELKQALRTIEHLRASPLMANHRAGLDAAHQLLSPLSQRPAAQAVTSAHITWDAEGRRILNGRLAPEHATFRECDRVCWVADGMEATGTVVRRHANDSDMVLVEIVSGRHWVHISRVHPMETKQATPEPVGEAVAWWYIEDGEEKFGHPNGYRPDDARPLVFGDTHPAPGVPEGFALVPIEPTPEMENAFRQAFTNQLHKRRNQWGRAKHTMSAEGAGLRAMLAAARPAPGVPEGWTDEQCLKFMCVALRHVEYKRGTKGPSCDDIRLGLKFALAAAQAKGGGHA